MKHDYPEDFEQNNGQYFHICPICGSEFIGHKYRRCCKVCLEKTTKAFDDLSQKQKDDIYSVLAENPEF